MRVNGLQNSDRYMIFFPAKTPSGELEQLYRSPLLDILSNVALNHTICKLRGVH